ncbi:4-hydroxy-3-methylbut-2-enyl diphosphate reductase [Thermopetrobacter sp. TC1]|uniref:4-hydroxy-3-methylbut-2-enyl diphosphate reductase n=1 Tax=Thermopetrobacter sp. TC1 TaxID=1495045 RepID=UPI0006913978|nr:4-hydroxy-3-methylbut-2-enyl diphosphate reductase [Thermopetrobacter sp. TC1]
MQISGKEQPVRILLAQPRGFCAGVVRAISIVERALEIYGAPVYVRHEIVHNRFVVDGLKRKGAVFVDELDEIADPSRPVIFSAHGVPKSVPQAADARGMMWIDATCPLVSKVHSEAIRHHEAGRHVLLIGHAGHPEVIGTMGQLPEGAITLIETLEDARTVQPPDPENLAYITQTTLSVFDTQAIVEELKRRFPAIREPVKDDICYATTNRQQVVREMAPQCDVVLVVGAPNSSNSRRLVEVAKSSGCEKAFLVQSAEDVSWQDIRPGMTVGLTAGASAPEVLVEGVIEAFRTRFDTIVELLALKEEHVSFKLPRALRKAAGEKGAAS